MQDDIKFKKKLLLATIENIDQEGRGVTHIDGKAIFVEGALQGELVVGFGDVCLTSVPIDFEYFVIIHY